MTTVTLNVTPQLITALQVACNLIGEPRIDDGQEVRDVPACAYNELNRLRCGLMAAEITAARTRRASS